MERWRGRTGCPSPDLLLPAQEQGILPEDLARAVRAHVAGCPLCTELSGALAGVASDPLPDEARRIEERLRFQTRGRWRRWMPSLAAAAALAAVAVGLYIARTGQRAPASVAQSGAPPVASPPQREPVLALAAPAILLPPESLTLRGEPRSSYAAALEDALIPFTAGNYQAAAAQLEKVTRDHPSRPHAEFYTGVARLMNGAAADATGPLQSARDLSPKGSPLSDEATWYLAVALERSGRGAAAAGPLTDLCNGSGPRKAQACVGLRLLSNR
jgi:hypothetical protein